MKLERTKNAVKNSIWGIMNSICSLIMPFLVRTVLIKVLGMEYLGLSSLFTSILSILNLSELGIGSAIVFSMYKPIATNDEKTICALMLLYRKIYRIIGVIILGVGVILMPFLSYLVKGTIPENINIYFLYFIYLINTVASYWLFAYRNSLVSAYQRTDILSKVALATNTMMYFVQIIVLFMFKNYYIYIIFLPLFSILNNIIVALFSKKMFPQYFCRGKISTQQMEDIKKRVTGLMMNKIAYASRNAFDSVIVSAILGLEVVAMYNNYYYIINAIAALMRVFMSAIVAGVGNSMETDSRDKNMKDMRIINYIYMTGACFCFCCILNLYQPFMVLWVGKMYTFPFYIMFAFSLYFLVEKAENVVGIYYDAAGLWWYGKWKGFIEALLNLILNIVLCKFLGVFGIVLATIITIVLIGFFMTAQYLFKFYYRKKSLNFIKEQITIVVKIILIGCIDYMFCSFVPYGITTYQKIIFLFIKLILSVIVCAFLYFIVFWKNMLFKESIEWVGKHINILKK